MEIDIIYPVLSKKKKAIENGRVILEWFLAAAAYACPIINICTGGKAWSLVALWAIWYFWNMLINRPLVEDNSISRLASALIYTTILFVLIELCLTAGWAVFVLPIIWFAMLLLIAAFFFTDVSRQRQNIMPMLWVIFGSFVAFVSAVIIMPRLEWPMIVMGAVAFGMLLISAIVLRWGLWIELRKRFHV